MIRPQPSLRFNIIKRLVLFLCIMSCFTGCQGQKTIVNALDEKEANEILVFLSGKRIDATKVAREGGTGGTKIIVYDISVNTDQATEAMYLLNQAGLPRRRGQNLLGIFGNVGLVPSDLEQKIRYEAGLAEQIAGTIRKIDGVLDAEVQISFPQEDPLNPGQYKGKITASVYVKHSGVLDDPNSHLITKIKRLVASSITGLDFDNVTVIPDRARFSETLTGFELAPEQEKQYVNVWGIILAKESITRFRFTFFTLVILLFISLLILIWFSWKVHPLLKKYGGMKELFHLRPIKVDKTDEPIAKEENAKIEKNESKDKKGPPIDKDVDIT